ncbi:MAG: hypothetical protein RML46_06625 [Anaerolineae bacterium]|nr:hypothetical protein [Anaerolineae bacterium]
MAILLLEGFENNVNRLTGTGTFIRSSSVRRTGSYGVAANSYYFLYGTQTTVRFGLAMYATRTNGPRGFSLRSGTTTVVAVDADVFDDRMIRLSWMGGSQDYLVPYRLTGVWVHLMLAVTHSTTTGSATLYLNSSPILSVSNVNTGSSSDNLLIYTESGGAAAYIDDLWITNSELLGDVRIWSLLPDGDSSVAWSRFPTSLTANYQAVDDGTDANGDTDYVFTTTAGAQDIYTFQDLTAVHPGAVAVQGVAIDWIARRSDAGSRTARPLLRISNTNYYGTSITLPESYQIFQSTWATNPNTGTSWTVADVNNLLAGIELQS